MKRLFNAVTWLATCFILATPSAFAEILQYTEYSFLPNSSYTLAPSGATLHTVSVKYSSRTIGGNVPLAPVEVGNVMRLRILMPPGTDSLSIAGESGDWQGSVDSSGTFAEGTYPVMGGVASDTRFCNTNPTGSNSTPCGSGSFTYPNLLETATGGLSKKLFGGVVPSPIPAARYYYFVLYQQPRALGSFEFDSLTITLSIADINLYNTWWNETYGSGAGNSNGNGAGNGNGTGTNTGDTSQVTLTISPSSLGIVTTLDGRINCGAGNNNCSAQYSALDSSQLTATPINSSYQFSSWAGGCSNLGGTKSPFTVVFSGSLSCSATFTATTDGSGNTNPPSETIDTTSSNSCTSKTCPNVLDYIDYPLVSAENYTAVAATNNNTLHTVKVSYSTRDSVGVPVPSLNVGDVMRLRIFMPPGADAVTIAGESGDWQGSVDSSGSFAEGTYPVMNGFTENLPFCHISPSNTVPTPCGTGEFIYPSDLEAATGGLSKRIFGGVVPNPITEPQYLYFIIYQQNKALGSFEFESLAVSISIANIEIYNNWLNGDTGEIIDPPIDNNTEIPTTQCTANRCDYSVSINTNGFYVARINLPEGKKEGQWGLSINNSSGLSDGGFSSGSVLRENGEAEGFTSFYLTEPTAVKLEVQEYSGNIKQLKVQIKKDNTDPVYGPILVNVGSISDIAELPAGYYVATVASQQNDPRGYFGIGIYGANIKSTVDVGGMIDATSGLGFIGIPVTQPITVQFALLFGDSYGTLGAEQPRLEIFRDEGDGNLISIWASDSQ